MSSKNLASQTPAHKRTKISAFYWADVASHCCWTWPPSRRPRGGATSVVHRHQQYLFPPIHFIPHETDPAPRKIDREHWQWVLQRHVLHRQRHLPQAVRMLIHAQTCPIYKNQNPKPIKKSYIFVSNLNRSKSNHLNHIDYKIPLHLKPNWTWIRGYYCKCVTILSLTLLISFFLWLQILPYDMIIWFGSTDAVHFWNLQEIVVRRVHFSHITLQWLYHPFSSPWVLIHSTSSYLLIFSTLFTLFSSSSPPSFSTKVLELSSNWT